MPELPEVTERFEADTGPYVAGLEAMVAAADRAKDANLSLRASIDIVKEGYAADAGAASEAAAATTAAGDSASEAAAKFVAEDEAMRGTAEAARDLAASEGLLAAANAAASESGVEMGRTASHLNNAFGMIVQSSDQVMMSSRQLDALNDRLRDSFESITIAAGYSALTQEQLAAINERLGAGERIAAEMAEDAAHAQAQLTATRLASMDATLALARSESVLADMESGQVAPAAKQAAAATEQAAEATNKVSSAQRHGLGWFRLTATGWHWLITGATEYLAVAVPGTIALAAGLAVDAQAAIAVADHMKDVYEVTHATADIFHESTSSVLGLSGAFQQAAAAARPQVYSDLGAALDIARERTGGLAQAGLAVSGIFDKFMAKMAYDFSSSGPFGKSGGLMSGGVSDLTEFGQILGNLGHALDEFAQKTPGIAEGLLQFADAASKAVVWISELPKPLIESAIIFHEFTMWGGLAVKIMERFGLATSELGIGALGGVKAVGILENTFKAIPTLAANALTGIGNMVSGWGRLGAGAERAGANIRNAGEDMKLAIADIPTATAALGAVGLAGIVAMIVALQRSKTAAQQFSESLQQVADRASNMQVMNVLSNNMAELAPRTREATDQLNQYSGALNHTVAGGKAATGVLTVLRENQDTYKSALSSTQTQMNAVQRGAEFLSKTYGISYTQALGLADAAQVKLNKGITGNSEAAQQAQQQVAALVHGYQAMGQGAGAMGNDMEAFEIQTGLASTKVSQLNQALDGLMSNATGLTSSFAAFSQQVTEIGDNGVKAGKAFTTFNGTAKAALTSTAESLKSFQGTGAQTWQNYDAALNSAEQFTDALRTSAALGAVGQTSFRQQIAYTVQQLLPYAKYSSAAASELGVLAQQAGFNLPASYQNLKGWTDKSSESTKQFNKQMNAEASALSDTSKMAQQFAGVMNSDVIAALEKGTINTAQVTSAAHDFDEAWRNASGTMSGPVKASLSQLFISLYGVTHNAGQARQYVDNLGRQMGLTSGQIARVNAYLKTMADRLDGLHSKRVTVTVDGQITGSGAAALAAAGVSTTTILHARPGAQTGASQTAGGVHLVGEMGPELVHLPTGTGVTPSWQTAPLLQGGSGGGGQMMVNLHVDSYIGGEKVASQQRTQVLTYSRRNTGNNLTLRTR